MRHVRFHPPKIKSFGRSFLENVKIVDAVKVSDKFKEKKKDKKEKDEVENDS